MVYLLLVKRDIWYQNIRKNCWLTILCDERKQIPNQHAGVFMERFSIRMVHGWTKSVEKKGGVL